MSPQMYVKEFYGVCHRPSHLARTSMKKTHGVTLIHPSHSARARGTYSHICRRPTLSCRHFHQTLFRFQRAAALVGSLRAGAGTRHGQLRRVRPRLLRVCRASHRAQPSRCTSAMLARASESSQCALAEPIADTELLVAAGLCWLTRTARRRCRHPWIRARLGLRTCAHCCCRTIATIRPSVRALRRALVDAHSEGGWSRAHECERSRHSAFPLCAPTCGLRCKSRRVRHRADALQVPTVVELNELGTFAKILYSISYGYANVPLIVLLRSIPCRYAAR